MASNLSSSLNYSTISARSVVRVHPPAPLYKENAVSRLTDLLDGKRHFLNKKLKLTLVKIFVIIIKKEIIYDFSELFANQLREVSINPNATRSNKILFPIHSTIAKIVSQYTSYKVISLPEKEYHFTSDIGSKDVDIAIVDENNNLKAAIMFKSIKSEYNKNANNYYENMKGESSLFIDNNISVYQIIFIPTAVRHKKSNGEKTFETPTENSYKNYCNFISNHSSYWNNLKLGVFYFDVDLIVIIKFLILIKLSLGLKILLQKG